MSDTPEETATERQEEAPGDDATDHAEVPGGSDHSGEFTRSEAALETLHEVATDQDLDTEEKIRAMLAVGTDRLGTATGLLARIEGDTWEVVTVAGVTDTIEEGMTQPLSTTYCRHTIDTEDPVGIADVPGGDFADDPAHEWSGQECYFGAAVSVAGERFGTVCFVDPEPREEAFTDREYTFAELLTNWIHYLLEQRAYERELEREQAFTESVIDSLPNPLYAFDESDRLIRWNDRLATVTGRDGEELDGLNPSDLVADADRERLERSFAEVHAGEHTSLEVDLATADGPRPYELSGAPLRDGTDAVVGVVGTGRDVSEHREHRERLSGLLDTTQSLMQARDQQHVAEIAVTAARDLLGFECSVFHLYDGDAGTLEPAAATDAIEDSPVQPSVYDVGSGIPGEVFASGEARVVHDTGGEMADLGDAVSVMFTPVGVRGTIGVASTEPEAFDEADEQLLALLATSAAGACTRAKREQDVREAREHTERVLDRVNGLIENTVEVLVAATTREEVETGVVEELSAADPYSFAWVSRPDPASDTLSPTAWAGADGISVEGQTLPIGGDNPLGRAFEAGTPQVLTDLDDAADPLPWFDAEADVSSVIAIPLGYKETTYGVLTVLTTEADAFDDRERVVLEALGRAVANAINAVERGRILDATEIIELEFSIGAEDLLFNSLSPGKDARLEAVTTEYRADGNIRLYLAATDVDPDALLDRAREEASVLEATCIVANEDDCLLEVVVEATLLATLAEHGALPTAVVAEEGATRFTVELPYEAEARELFELVEEQFPRTELLGYRERERPVETRQDFTAQIRERLTDRQQDALRTAYFGGFFDWPRDVDGNELAEAMDISRPTYHQHLRAAQAKVFEALYE